jgi:2,3-bisphosphoglycerate-independent phosphoglycerate mutase
MSEQKTSRPAVLCILDGWGHRDDPTDNAIAQADTPNWDRMMATCPQAFLQTSGDEVGLPDGQMGNSEVGHMNLGAGRVVMQDLPRIDRQVASGALLTNDTLQDQITTLLETGGTCHLLGLLSPGGVHSHQDHMVALATAVSTAGIPVCVHAFLDGRDTPPKSAAGYMEEFLSDIDSLQGVTVATVTGRYFAMDRDQRWERVVKGYDAMTRAVGTMEEDALFAVEHAYAADQTDEFVEPRVIGDYAGMMDGDGLLMANFRADRAREILTALVDDAFDGFEREILPDFASVIGLVEYSKALNEFIAAMYPPRTLSDTIGEVVANTGGKQLRIAETEKYAHVTFFFNGGEETVFEGEERILVPSPRVATYDLQPEMSAVEVTDKLVAAIASGKFDFILVNYANGDMVGHTGILSAAIKAAETLDGCLARLEEEITKAGGSMFVTADHGNAECMRDATTGEPHTAHTMDAVPAVLVNPPEGINSLTSGRLADVAPTMLALMGLEKPDAMTGEALLSHRPSATKQSADALSTDAPSTDDRASA